MYKFNVIRGLAETYNADILHLHSYDNRLVALTSSLTCYRHESGINLFIRLSAGTLKSLFAKKCHRNKS